MKRLLCLVALAIAVVPVAAQEARARAEVLVLGVYHMNNPGRDIFNSKSDDVLAPNRQAEIAQVVAALKTFQPTKIAVEAEAGNERTQKNYADYVAGKRELTRNEVEQLGFRLAKEMGHKTVHPVDVDGEFPYARLLDYVKAHDRQKEFEALNNEIGRMVKEQDAYLASHSILETLVYMNSDTKVAGDVGFYFRQAEYGEPWNWAGADLVSDWFRRNMRIYSNVMQLVDSPNERVLVIYGAGHLGWLQYAFSSNPTVRLRKLAEFAGK